MDLIVYGSLMHPDALLRLEPRAAIPVWVRGYRRAYDQRPMWRGDGRGGRNVLAARPEAGARFNAVLLVGIRRGWVAALDERERGYIRTFLPRGRLWPFAPHRFPPLPYGVRGYELYVGRDSQRSDRLVPLGDYRALCQRAAEAWGGSFARWFERTTRVESHRTDAGT